MDLKNSGGWIFRPFPVADGLIVLGGWRIVTDGWTEALTILNLDDAKANRCNPAGELVWQHEGGLVDAIDGLLDLPAPGTPNAPTLIIGQTPTLWTPR